MNLQTKYNRSMKDEKNFYVKISEKLVRDTNLNATAKGVMLIILANNDKYILHKSVAQKQANMGRKGFDTVWNSLMNHGYIQSEKFITKEGIVYQYTINEDPSNSLILTGDPLSTVGLSTVGKESSNNNQKNNNQKNNITKTSDPVESLSISLSDEEECLNTFLKDANADNNVDTDKWTVTKEDKAIMADLLRYHELEHLKDRLYILGDREGLKYVSLSILYKDLNGETWREFNERLRREEDSVLLDAAMAQRRAERYSVNEDK